MFWIPSRLTGHQNDKIEGETVVVVGLPGPRVSHNPGVVDRVDIAAVGIAPLAVQNPLFRPGPQTLVTLNIEPQSFADERRRAKTFGELGVDFSEALFGNRAERHGFLWFRFGVDDRLIGHVLLVDLLRRFNLDLEGLGGRFVCVLVCQGCNPVRLNSLCLQKFYRG